jgi:DNA-binding transcriptional LysR family regulator
MLSHIKGAGRMNITRIEYFLMAAKYMSFTKAAAQLYITQPSLSKQIAILEEELGQKLFERNKKNLRLTYAGKLMYAEFERVLPQITAVIEKVRQINNDSVGILVLACVESLYISNKMTETIRKFSTEFKEIDLFFERCSFETIRNRLNDGTIDVAFTISNQIKNPDEFNVVEIEQRRRYIILSSSHKLAHKETLNIADLKDETIIMMDREKSLVTNDDIYDAFRESGYFPKIRYAPSNETILDYLEFGSGIAFLDKSIIENRKNRLKCYPTSLKSRFSLVCIWKKENANPVLLEFTKRL